MNKTLRPTRAKRRIVALDAPDAQTAAVTGSFCGWDPVAHPLKRNRHGVWKTTLMLPPGHYEYRFLVDGQWQDDPTCPERIPNPFGSENCVFQV
jgi:1,4-alpha-glucan branching enzyme